MTIPVRSQVVSTGEVFINLNDLIIKLMVMADHAQNSDESDAIKKVIDYLVQKREKTHAASSHV